MMPKGLLRRHIRGTIEAMDIGTEFRASDLAYDIGESPARVGNAIMAVAFDLVDTSKPYRSDSTKLYKRR